MKRKIKKIVVHFKGDFYLTDFYDYETLKELIKQEEIKRSDITEWWKVYE